MSRVTSLIALLALLLGVVWIAVLEPGFPYDEASHLETIEVYRSELRLPQLGPGVPYEALYYAVSALLLWIIPGGADSAATVDVLRGIWLVVFIAGGALLVRETAKLVHPASSVATGAVAIAT